MARSSTRRQAASWAALLLGAAYLFRIVGEVAGGASWLSWATPIGWATELSPFVDPAPAVLVLFVCCMPVQSRRRS